MDYSNRIRQLKINDLLSRAPFATMMIALGSGILCGYMIFNLIFAFISCVAAVFSIFTILIIARKSPTLCLTVRPYYRIPQFLAFFSLGMMAWIYEAPVKHLPQAAEITYGTARITDITTTTSGDKLILNVLYFESSKGKHIQLNSSLKAIARTDVTSFHIGDIIRFRNNLQPIEDVGVFDGYASMMLSHGIAWQQYLPSSHIQFLRHEPTLATKMLSIRDRFTAFIDRTSLHTNTKQFIQAIILGDRSNLDEETQIEFSSVGVAHMLALSGFHLGIIILIINVFLYPTAFFIHKKMRLFLLMIGIWGFALITGMSISVLRAAIMATVMIIAAIMEKKRSGINTICAAAFFILLFNPVAILNISFQLSFLTCAAIIVYGNQINNLFKHNKRKRYIIRTANIAIISIVAFISSWMLSAYYFHSIPLLFLPANIIASVFVSTIFITSIIYLPLYAFGWDIHWIASLNDMLLNLLNQWCHTIGIWQPSVDNVYIHGAVPWIYIGAMIFYAIWMEVRQNHWLLNTANLTMMACALCIIFLPVKSSSECLSLHRAVGEIHVSYTTGREIRHLNYPRGCISKSDINKYKILIADREFCGIDSTDIKTNLMIIGREGSQTIGQWLETGIASRVVIARHVDESERQRLDSVAKSHNTILDYLDTGNTIIQLTDQCDKQIP